MTENELLQACLLEERTAQYELVRQFGPRLLTVCRRYAPVRLDPEDILQDTFVRIFSCLDQYDQNKGQLWPWMKTIAIRESLKKHRLTRKWFLQSQPMDDHPEVGGPEQVPMPDEAELILAFIRQLPDGYREVFNLVAIEGYTHDECASLLGIAPGTSRSCLSRARKMLQHQLVRQNVYDL